jgi:hypothetical protein
MPINYDFTLLDLAVYECACAGVKSIWISINDDWAPIIKKRLRDYVMDPVWQKRTMDPMPYQNKRLIPIFLVPCHARYYNTRDSEGWGYINAALYASLSARRISNFLIPDVFYATSPYVVYEPSYISKFRKVIQDKKRFMFESGGKNFLNDSHHAFTFLKEDIKIVRQYINDNATMRYTKSEEYELTGKGPLLKQLPKDERYSGKNFGLNNLFSHLNEKDYCKEQLNWSYTMNGWEDYRKYMRDGKEFKKPSLLERKSIYKIYGDKND